MKKIELRFHKRDCYTCRYYRIHGYCSECLLLGRTLTLRKGNFFYSDRARLCDGWKRRPNTWNIYVKKNCYYSDKYIPRESQLKIRKRLGIKKLGMK